NFFHRFPPVEWLHIYTDGSLLDFAQGAGIGVFSHLFSFYLHAGPLTTHFDGEVEAIHIALQQLAVRLPPIERAVILSDSTSALQALSNYNENNCLRVQNCRELLGKIKGKINFRRDLTHHSAKLEIKRIFRESFRRTASRVARDKPWSTLCKKSHGIPSSPRVAVVAKFRFLTGHDYLCAHLFRFNLVTSPICVLCDTGQDMTAAHLGECSALNDLNCIDEVEKLAYQLNEEAEWTERPIRRLSKVMYGRTCEDMQVDVMGECLSSIKHVVGTTYGCFYTRSNHWEVGGRPQCDKCGCRVRNCSQHRFTTLETISNYRNIYPGFSVVVVHEEPHQQMTGTLSYRPKEKGDRQREKSLDTRHRRQDDGYRILPWPEDCTVVVCLFDALGTKGLQFLFMGVNAPCHRTVAAEQLLESEDIERMDWPARSPDLNPIEHVLDFLGKSLAARTLPPVTIRALRLALQDEWAAMPTTH
ncbi:uncharacterized protein LOC103524116, partial [Trichonephila clavipes]